MNKNGLINKISIFSRSNPKKYNPFRINTDNFLLRDSSPSPTPIPTPPSTGAFSNAFSNAFNI